MSKVGSFQVEDFTEGGFFDDRRATIAKAEVVAFDYQGQMADDPVCALAITYRPADEGEEERTEYYTVGKLSKFTPSSDGKFYVPTGTAAAMNKNAKAALYLRALHEKGFNLSLLSDGIDKLEGLDVHVNIVPMPEMKNVTQREGQKKPSILLVTKIYGEAGAAKPKASTSAAKRAPATKATAAAPAAATATGGGDAAAVDEEAAMQVEMLILGLLAERNPFPAPGLPSELFKQVTDASERGKCMKVIANKAWMGGQDRPWTLEGGQLTAKG